ERASNGYRRDRWKRPANARRQTQCAFIERFVTLYKCNRNQPGTGLDRDPDLVDRTPSSASPPTAHRDHFHALAIHGDLQLMLVARRPGGFHLNDILGIERKVCPNRKASPGSYR